MSYEEQPLGLSGRTVSITGGDCNRGKAAIINIASMGSYVPISGVWANEAAKAGVLNLTMAAAKEFAPHGRFGEGGELAGAVLYLASNSAAGLVTCVCIHRGRRVSHRLHLREYLRGPLQVGIERIDRSRCMSIVGCPETLPVETCAFHHEYFGVDLLIRDEDIEPFLAHDESLFLQIGRASCRERV
jgi:hypothetical protein